MIDERREKPSASTMGRVVNCSPSHQMELEAKRRIPDKRDDKDANAGELVHAILSNDAEPEDVTYSAEATAEMCEAQTDRLVEGWCDDTPIIYSKEIRLGLTALNTVLEVTPESRADFIFTGKYDRLYIQGERGLLIDFKALNGAHAAAVENPQLASLAVLVSKRHKLTSLRVAIVQPRKGRPTVADYPEGMLHLAESWLAEALLKEAQATPDDRKAGSWCTHCRARFGCDTFKASAIQQLEHVQPMSIAGLGGKEQRQAMFARAMDLSPESHVGAFKGLAMVKRYVDAIEGAFKARVEAGEIPGWTIQARPGNREITDTAAAWNALSPLGVTVEQVMAACSIPVGAMEDAVRQASGIKKKTATSTKYNLTIDQAKEKLNDALTKAGALGRQADRKELVEITNTIEA